MACRFEFAGRLSTSCLAVVFFLLSAVSGCSFVAVRPPPDDARRGTSRSTDCTDSYVAPAADTVIGGLFAAGATSLAISADNYEESECGDDESYCGGFGPDPKSFKSAGAILLAIPAVIHAASAVYGYVSVSECHDAGEAREHEVEREARHRRFYQR